MDSAENIRCVRHFTHTYIELTIHPRRRTKSKRRHGKAPTSSQFYISKKRLSHHRCHILKHRKNVIQQLFFEKNVFTHCIENR